MKIAGIIAEYNPFHAGHFHHVQKTREETGCDYVIAVMSGAFTQRGECAFIDKFARVKSALMSGVDAVFELPQVCAVRPADAFARGGVSVLSAAGADVLSFGCENADLSRLKEASSLLDNEPGWLKDAIKRGLDEGKTLARARGEAISAHIGMTQEEFAQPNLALAIEYLTAINRLDSRMTPFVIQRTSPYHATDLIKGLSASEIRLGFRTGRWEEALSLLPDGSREIVRGEYPCGISDSSLIDGIVLYHLRQNPPPVFADAGEGLSERIINEAKAALGYEDLIDRVKCKRYTRARITRAITSALLGLPAKAPDKAPYVRLLGFRNDKRELIREINKRSGGCVISNPALLENDPSFQIERRATDLWGMTVRKKEYRAAGRERTEKFIRI